jgi:branched-chain amino acid transport system substrate-binding protein
LKRAIVCLLAGFLTCASQAQTGQPITIGGSLELSGALASLGQDVLAGAEFAVDVINKRGGVLGRPVQLVHQDNGSNSQRAVSQSIALAEASPAMLLSPLASGSALAASKMVSAKFKLPMCTTTAGAEEITMKEFQPYIMAMNPNSYMLMRAVTTRLSKQPYKRYAVMVPDYAGGRSAVVRFKEFMKELNPKAEIVDEEYPKLGATDFTANINKILAAKPDYVWAEIFGNDLLTFTKQATAVGFFKQMNNHFLTVVDNGTLLAFGDDLPVGIEAYGLAPFNSVAKTEEGKDFVKQYKAKTGNYPSDWVTMGYDCVNVWAQAANAANSTDADALMRTIEKAPLRSLRGTARFGKSDHQWEAPVYIGKVTKSKEYGQAILAVEEAVPGAVTRATDAVLQKSREQ